MNEDIHRTNPPINAMDFGVPPLFAERAENYARWAVQAEREACAKVCMEIEQSKPLSDRVGWEHGTVDCQVAIRARGQA